MAIHEQLQDGPLASEAALRKLFVRIQTAKAGVGAMLSVMRRDG